MRAQSKEGEVLSTIACATSSIVTTLVIAAGVLLFSPVLPYLTNDDSVLPLLLSRWCPHCSARWV